MAVSKVILNGDTLIDVTQKTVDSENMLSGTTALKNDGTNVTGSIASKAAATYYPSTTDQTITGSRYLSGNQTIKAVAISNTLVAENIAQGVTVTVGDADDDDRILSVTGTMQGGGNLVEKTITASQMFQAAAPNASLCSMYWYGYPIERVSGASYTSSAKAFVPSTSLVLNAKYRVIGCVKITNGCDVLESHTFDKEITWVTAASVSLLTPDSNSVIQSLYMQRQASNDQYSLSCMWRTAGYYGIEVSATVLESTALYDGLSKVSVYNNYSNDLMVRYLERNSSFHEFVLPSDIRIVGDYAFAYSVYLESINLPSTITSINQYAFYQCQKLKITALPSALISLGPSAFRGCKQLTISSIPSGVTSIPDYCFNSCTGITSMTLPSGVTQIGTNAFESCSNMASISLPNSLTTIGNSAFAYCSALELTSFPGSVTNIGQYVLRGCGLVESISCDGAITSMGSYAFNGTSSAPMAIRSAKFPHLTSSATLTYVFGSSTAANACQLLEEADIGSASLSSGAFAFCYALQTLVLRRTSVVPLGNTSYLNYTPFSGYGGLTGTVYVPSALINDYKTATNWSTLYNNGTCTFAAIEGSAWDLS